MEATEDVRGIQNLTTATQGPAILNSMPIAEPVPDWVEAKQVWGVAWEIHWIGLGVAFSVLALSSVIALLRSNKKRRFGGKPFVIAVNSLLLVLSVSRALYLLLDPYESRQNGIEFPRWLAQLLFNIAFPCLTSAFCLIFLVFLGVAKLQLVSKKLQSTGFLTGVMSLHFGIVLAAEVCVIVEPEAFIPVIMVCHLFFVVWGLLLSVGFIYGGFKVIYQVEKVKKHLRAQRRTSTTKVAKVTLVTSCLGIACSILQLFSLISVYRFYRHHDEVPSSWMWWGFQTCSRLVEIAMVCTISYCIMQPSVRNRHGSSRGPSSAIQEKIISEKNIEGIQYI